ncbi:MAG: sigma-70 family RNA polymerase sigma factor [Acidobacteriaceae bacterium]|nr:sigma-70 family RNA polymerase sigma factor [Acidobacteriaceae bacterium]
MNSRRLRQQPAVPASWTHDIEAPATGLESIDLPNTAASDELAVLFRRYSQSVLGTACRVLGNRSEAEEVVQEVFFYVYRKSQLFDPLKGSLKAWIIQIAFSRALDRKSHLARQRFCRDDNIASLPLRAETDLDQQIDAKLTRTHLETAIAGLTERQRRTIEFFYFDGLDLREISAELGEPLGSVRHHLYRGLARLRRSSLLRQLRFVS